LVERSCSSNCNKRFPFSVKFVNDSERSPRVVPISAAEQPPAAALVLVVLHEVWFVCAGLQAGRASWAAARRLENCQTLSRGAWLLPLLVLVVVA